MVLLMTVELNFLSLSPILLSSERLGVLRRPSFIHYFGGSSFGSYIYYWVSHLEVPFSYFGVWAWRLRPLRLVLVKVLSFRLHQTDRSKFSTNPNYWVKKEYKRGRNSSLQTLMRGYGQSDNIKLSFIEQQIKVPRCLPLLKTQS